MKQEQKPDLLAEASSEALSLGMSYGEFSAMCSKMFPVSRNPISLYFEDRHKAEIANAINRGEKYKICPVCGTKFLVSGSHQNTKYCSKECYNEVGRERMRKRYYLKKEKRLAEKEAGKTGQGDSEETGQESQ